MLLQILKKSTFILCAGAMFVFSSCSGEEVESTDTESTVNEPKNETPRSMPNKDRSVDGATDGNVEKKTSQDIPMKMKATPSGEVRLNPPHGEPGHDCAVEVGQPLNSAGGNSPAMVQPSPNMIQPTPSTVQPTNNGSVKLNPPHGQPGHDCGVEVGQPLN
ncbi:MAG TPA: hypothetical protein VKY37_11640 [Brumimicrobium sp.]|nr:hypothetical protein [Brumimicrobium sp.]